MIKKTNLIGYLTILTFLLFSCSEKGVQNEEQKIESQAKVITQPTSMNKVDKNILAAVRLLDNWGFIDQNGVFVIEPTFPQGHNFSDGYACVNIGGQRLDESRGVVGGKYTFVGPDGKIMGWQFDGPSHFYEGHTAIKQSGFHFIIKTDEAMLNATFDVVGKFDGGLAPAQYKKENKIGYVDYFGVYKIKTDPSWLIYPYSEGLARVKVDGKWGYLNQNGEFAIDPVYPEAYSFKNGFAAVVENNQFGFIDPTGKLSIKAQYEDASDFHEGLVGVVKNGKWGFIDEKGNEVIPFEFENARNFSEGLAAVQKDGKVGYIDKEGNWAIQPRFPAAYDFSKGLAIYQENNRLMGYIDKTGEVVIPAQFIRASRFVDIHESNEMERVN